LEWSLGSAAFDASTVAHSALCLSSLKTTLFDRGWAGTLGALLSRFP